MRNVQLKCLCWIKAARCHHDCALLELAIAQMAVTLTQPYMISFGLATISIIFGHTRSQTCLLFARSRSLEYQISYKRCRAA